MLTETGWAIIMFENAVVLAPVRVVKRTERIIGSMTAVDFSLLSPYLLSFYLLLFLVSLIMSALQQSKLRHGSDKM